AGYRLLAVKAIHQEYAVLDEDELPDGTPDERSLGFSWDFMVLDADNFSVMVALNVRGNKAAPDQARAMLVGEFEVKGEPRIKRIDFIKSNAVAMLLPYAREVIAGLTSRGLGAFHVPALNVLRVLEDHPLEETSGYAELAASAELASV